jgi:hypothetical protein
MKTKLIVIALSAGILFGGGGGYYYYQHNYVETLMLSEIVGHSENDIVNILVNLGDFDTGLTRHDISNLKSNGNYWIGRINEVNAIIDPELQQQANIKLIADMMEDPTMKKVCKIITAKGFEFAVNIIETII